MPIKPIPINNNDNQKQGNLPEKEAEDLKVEEVK